ncbi:AGE family epimerase/isomerase [candidate division KSB1 bacterium]|nr:AGE family epimerase/isomerase [candidate division KSB1 bacterium]
MVSLNWFERQFYDVLERYSHISPTPQGLLLSRFDADWRCTDDQTGHLVAQSRLIYNFVSGYNHSGRAEYLRIVASATDFLLKSFWDTENGGFYSICDRRGTAIDNHKESYGHCFALFGLAHAAQITGRKRYRQAAFDTWDFMQSHFFDAQGGLVLRLTRDLSPLKSTKSQNPMMHLVEALLQLELLDSRDSVREDLDRIIRFVLDLRRSDGILSEIYCSDWQPCDSDQGGRIDIGHHFEWAFLLSQAVHQGHSPELLDAGNQFLSLGIAQGFDESWGCIVSPLSPDGSPARAKKCWWEQCEAVRALMRYEKYHGRTEANPILRRCIDFIDRYLLDRERGGWYSCYAEKAERDTQLKSGDGKVYYHIVGMCLEAFDYFQPEQR